MERNTKTTLGALGEGDRFYKAGDKAKIVHTLIKDYSTCSGSYKMDCLQVGGNPRYPVKIASSTEINIFKTHALMRTTGIHQLMHTKFDRMPFDGEWRDLMGQPSWDFSCLIYGNSGNGKTTKITGLVKYLCGFGLRTCYISHEEGIGATMQDAFKFADMMAVSGGVILAEDTSFDEMVEYFGKRGSPEVMVIDSIDYCNLTKAQYQYLRKRFPRKIIIMISWSEGSKPKCQAAKDIEYMVDVKLFIKDFMVWPKSRFGGNEPQPIWEERARLLNQKWFEDRDKKLAKAAAEKLKMCPAVSVEVVPTVVNLPKKTVEIAENSNEGGGVDADH